MLFMNKYTSFINLTLISIMMLILCISYITPASAATCACYFSKYNDCREVYVDDKSKDNDCIETCKSEVGNTNSIEFLNDALHTNELLIINNCSKAHLNALTQQQKLSKPSSILKGAVMPVLNIDIPNVKFSPPKINGEYIHVEYISQYVSGVYKYLLSIGSIIAVVMIMIGGLQYSIGAVSEEQINKAKKRIKDAVIGLVLLLSTILILQNTNPNLIKGISLQLEIIRGVPLPDETSAPDVMPGKPPSVAMHNILGGSAKTVIAKLDKTYTMASTTSSCTIENARKIAQELHDKQICVGPCHCAWTAGGFIRYLKCAESSSGNATKLPFWLEHNEGWISEKITKDNRKNLPLGVVMSRKCKGKCRYGHIGVSIGQGQTFESGSGSYFKRAASDDPSCKSKHQSTYKKNAQCKKCGKIEGHTPRGWMAGGWFIPGTTKPKPKNRTCSYNQGWSIGPLNPKYKIITRPPAYENEVQKKGCCGSGNKWFVSQVLCEGIKRKWTQASSKESCIKKSRIVSKKDKKSGTTGDATYDDLLDYPTSQYD
jgi:hypothetical protein